ncbi:hypothetical protein COP2_024596 [Malus domestica]
MRFSRSGLDLDEWKRALSQSKSASGASPSCDGTVWRSWGERVRRNYGDEIRLGVEGEKVTVLSLDP